MPYRERPDVWDEDGRDIDRWENDGGRSHLIRLGISALPLVCFAEVL